MIQERDAFLMHKLHYPALKQMSNEMLGEFIRAVYEYQIEGAEPAADSPINIAFLFVKAQFDIDERKYNAVVERNRENGSKGGRPVKPDKKPKEPTGLNENPKNPGDAKKAEYGYDGDYGNGSDNEEKLNPPPSPRARKFQILSKPIASNLPRQSPCIPLKKLRQKVPLKSWTNTTRLWPPTAC
ncbi:DUF6291 domain-containing protein [Salmonirosea aquatica]|uniref:DUF6291 domain-containing protein n=1 Tax=Salmonirosea aquatica TaxID=2654236 RepID=A0A7C9BV25_9BACT|nr:hypothetical protein [Cytophagaceae bacterium SJW1-29]